MTKKLTSLLVVFSMMNWTIYPLWAMERDFEDVTIKHVSTNKDDDRPYTLMNSSNDEKSCIQEGCEKALKCVLLPLDAGFELFADYTFPVINSGIKLASLAATGSQNSPKYFKGGLLCLVGLGVIGATAYLAIINNLENTEFKVIGNSSADGSFLGTASGSTDTEVIISTPFSGPADGLKVSVGLGDQTISLHPKFSGGVDLGIPFGETIRKIFPESVDKAAIVFITSGCLLAMLKAAYNAHKNNPKRSKPIAQLISVIKEKIGDISCCCSKSEPSDENGIFTKMKIGAHYWATRLITTGICAGSVIAIVYCVTDREIRKAAFEYNGNFSDQHNFTDAYQGHEEKSVAGTLPGGASILLKSVSDFQGHVNATTLLNTTVAVSFAGLSDSSLTDIFLPLSVLLFIASGLVLLFGNLTTLAPDNSAHNKDNNV